MIVYPAEYTRMKETLFASLARVDGGRRLRMIPLSFRDFPETAPRVADAFARAKRQPKGALGRFLKRQLIRGQYNWSRAYFTRNPDHIAVAWNGLTGSRRAFMAGAKDAGAARLFAELAPFPGRVTLDPAGVNAESGLPREADFYREWAAGQEPDEGWRDMGEFLRARPSRRVDVAQDSGADLRTVGNFLFVPLQVPSDSQITLFAGWVKSVEGMLDALVHAAACLPEGWHIRIKEHPSARVSLSEVLADVCARAGGRLVVDNQTDTFAQVRASQGVITINSSVGLQAMFDERPVITLGQAFFAIEGLVHVADSPECLATLLAAPEKLSYDAPLRAAFLSYLDRVYYPRVARDALGTVEMDIDVARGCLLCATAAK